MTSASSTASTTESGPAEVRLIGPRAISWGSSRSPRRSAWRSRWNSTSSKWHRWPTRRSAGSWTTASSGTRRPRRPRSPGASRPTSRSRKSSSGPRSARVTSTSRCARSTSSSTRDTRSRSRSSSGVSEMAHPELGTKILDDVLAMVGHHVKVETQARLEGRNMSMVLSPDKKAIDAARARRPGGRQAAATTAEPPRSARRPAPTEPADVRGHAVRRAGGALSPERWRRNPHAEDEDEQDRRQAVQDHRVGPPAPPAGDAPAPVREEAVDARRGASPPTPTCIPPT